MERSNVSAEGDHFFCYPLSKADGRDVEDILAFEPVDPQGMSLVAYLWHSAAFEEREGLMRTYLVRDKNTYDLAGYFSLKAGLITMDEGTENGRTAFDTEPGIELANFAVNGVYRDHHPDSVGCGAAMFDELIVPIVLNTAEQVGVAAIYLFALPEKKVEDRYRAYGFERLDVENERRLHARIKPRYDADCTFMMMRLWE